MTSSATRRERPRWWRSLAPALLVFTLVAGAASTAATVLRHAEHRHAAATLDRRAQAAAASVTADVRRYLDVAQDLSVATATQTGLTAQDFETITSRVRPERLPGVGSVLLVAPDEQVRYIRPVSASTGSGGGAGEDRQTPVDPVAPDRTAVRRVETVEAMAEARTNGQVTVSRIITAAQRSRQPDAAPLQIALVVVAPVFGEPATADQGDFRGWLLLTLRTGSFLVRTLHSIADGEVGVGLADATDPDHPVPVVSTTDGGTDRGPDLTRHVDVQVAQRTWQLTVSANGPLVTGVGAYADEVTLGCGVLIAGLLAWMMWLLATSRERALQRVDQATAALRDDIARRETVEARLRDREAELAGFVAVAAHDLKTPLTNVAAYADLLAEVAVDDLDLTCRGFVERIATGTRRMTRLIEDLLDFAASDNAPLRPEPVDLAALVTDVIAEHTTYLGDTRSTDTRPNIEVGSLPTVQGDLAALRRLMDNLIGNAIKYVRHGDTAQIGVAARREPDGWRIEVADRGIGIPAEQRQAVFGAFHRDRAAEGYPGTGLGLAICQRIVDRHGGHIGVEANPGGGSRFWFTLPTTIPADRTAPEEAPAATLTASR